MSARSSSKLEYLIRGSELWGHQLSMLAKAFGHCATVALLVFMAVQVALPFLAFSSRDRTIYFYNRVAAIESTVGLGWNGLLARNLKVDGQEYGVLRPEKILQATKLRFDDALAFRAGLINLVSLMSAAAVFAYLLRFYRRFGVKESEDIFLRGARLVSPEDLSAEVQKKAVSPYQICGIPLPANMEMRNFLITGSQGSGKTVVFYDLMDQVFARKKKAIIYDKKGEYTAMYYRPEQDFILNVFDDRAVGWALFSEISLETDFDQIAHSLCPDPEDKNSTALYFAAGARALFAEAARHFWNSGKYSTRDLVNFLLTSTPKDLFDALKGTPAAAFIDPNAAEQAGGVLSTLTAAIGCLKFVKDGSFSVRDWVERDGDSRLFINSNESVQDVLRPVTAMWLDLAIRHIMTLDLVFEDRIWLFLDELASLKQVPIIPRSVTETRAYGAVHVIGLQNEAQSRTMFGKDPAQTFRGNLQTILVLRVTDEETAEAYSKLLSVQELDEKSDGKSFGVAPSRDGSNIQTGRKEKRIVLASEIQTLDDCEGFLRIVGNYPVARVKYQRRDRVPTQPDFCPRDDLKLSRIRKPVVSAPATVQVDDDLPTL